jgi:hypothetical protein
MSDSWLWASNKRFEGWPGLLRAGPPAKKSILRGEGGGTRGRFLKSWPNDLLTWRTLAECVVEWWGRLQDL